MKSSEMMLFGMFGLAAVGAAVFAATRPAQAPQVGYAPSIAYPPYGQPQPLPPATGPSSPSVVMLPSLPPATAHGINAGVAWAGVGVEGAKALPGLVKAFGGLFGDSEDSGYDGESGEF
jgi:hypothetical protein